MTTIWAGLYQGALYAIVTVGYNLVFIGSGTFNFAQSNLMMLGTFLTYWTFEQLKLPIFPVFLVVTLMVGVIALVEERIAIRPVHEIKGYLVTTVGAATLMTGIVEAIWGQTPLEAHWFANSPVHVLGGISTPADLILMLIAVISTAGAAIFSRYTVTGLAAVSSSEDSEVAQLRGINTRRLGWGVFVVSGLLAGIVGVFMVRVTTATYTLPSSLALISFVALAIGGYGSIVGSSLAAFVLGLVEAITSRYLGGQYVFPILFGVLLAVLLILPNGFFGARRERVV